MLKYQQENVADLFSMLIGSVTVKTNFLFVFENVCSRFFSIFVCFRACAEQGLNALNGTQLGGQSIRLSWGRTTSNKQVCIRYTMQQVIITVLESVI